MKSPETDRLHHPIISAMESAESGGFNFEAFLGYRVTLKLAWGNSVSSYLNIRNKKGVGVEQHNSGKRACLAFSRPRHSTHHLETKRNSSSFPVQYHNHISCDSGGISWFYFKGGVSIPWLIFCVYILVTDLPLAITTRVLGLYFKF